MEWNDQMIYYDNYDLDLLSLDDLADIFPMANPLLGESTGLFFE